MICPCTKATDDYTQCSVGCPCSPVRWNYKQGGCNRCGKVMGWTEENARAFGLLHYLTSDDDGQEKMNTKSTVYGKSKVLYVRIAPKVYDALDARAKAEGVTKRIICEAILRRALGFDGF